MTFEKLLQQSLIWRGFYFITVLLINVFLSRYLKAEGAGWIYYLTNVFSFVLLVASLSIESGYTFYASGNIIDHNKLAWFSLAWTLLIAIVIAAGIGIYFGAIKQTSPVERNEYILYAVTYISGILLTNFFTVLFYAHKNFLLPNAIMSALNIILIATIIIAAKRHISYNQLVNIYFFFFLLQGLLLALVFMIVNKSFQQISYPSKPELNMLLKYSLIALAGNLVFFLVYRIDYWFVRYNPQSCSPEDMGNYIQASKMGQFLLIIPQILASVIFPQTASGTLREEVNTSIMRLFRLFMQAFIALGIVLAIAGPFVFPWIFGETFHKINTTLLLLLPGIFGVSVLTLLSAYFSGKGRVRRNVEGAAIALIVVIIGNFIFIPIFGIYGAAVVSAVGYLVNLAYALWHFFRDYQLSISELFTWRTSDWQWVTSMLLHKK